MLLVTTDPVARVCMKQHPSPLVCWNECMHSDNLWFIGLLSCLSTLSVSPSLSVTCPCDGRKCGQPEGPSKVFTETLLGGLLDGTIVTLTSPQEDSALLVTLSGFL